MSKVMRGLAETINCTAADGDELLPMALHQGSDSLKLFAWLSSIRAQP